MFTILLIFLAGITGIACIIEAIGDRGFPTAMFPYFAVFLFAAIFFVFLGH